ncbi:MAG: V-type ATP synthase subunit I [Phycisphaerales bacterium]|nr:MAG: V-type ATP synthase subunit I [Phycisphaerales bacterium]
MAVARMAKFIIVTHRAEAARLLETLQAEGICQILNAEEAVVTRDEPDLAAGAERPRDLEDFLGALEASIKFLSGYAPKRGSVFEPRSLVDQKSYNEVVSDPWLPRVAQRARTCAADIEKLRTRIEELNSSLEHLAPWKALATPVEQIASLTQLAALPGLVPAQHLDKVNADLDQFDAVLEQIGRANTRAACIIVCPKDNVTDVQRLLRLVDFEPVSFEGLTGTVADLMDEYTQMLRRAREQLRSHNNMAVELSKSLLKLRILCDHHRNLLRREQARSVAPGTESTVILEGWVKQRDYSRLEKILSGFAASGLTRVEPAEDEDVPVEIDNARTVEPFEVITRLYGMPHSTDVDPTPLLAPFFGLFFGICLTDAAYGLVMIGFLWWLLKKTKGARFIRMMMFCSVTTVVAGALTGGWCGDAIQVFVPRLKAFRQSLMWFDPLDKPMHFFVISLALGYLQIMFGVAVAFWRKWKRGQKKYALCDHLTWFVWLNCLVVFGMAKAGYLPESVGMLFGFLAIVPAAAIVLFSEREGGLVTRIGMGCYNLFSTVFYVGDVLSYIRLMALGMVTAGFGMAINEIVAKVMALGAIGWILGGVIFIVGHLFNIANSSLSAFVHSMRLQFVEFFTKFMVGGGKQFEPLSRKYEHIEIDRQSQL